MASKNDSTESISEEAEKICVRSRNLSQRIAVYSNRIVGESDAFAAEVKSLQQSLKNLKYRLKEIDDANVKKEVASKAQEAKDVIEGLGPGGDMRRLCNPRHPWPLKLLLGDKVNLIALRRDQLLAMKREYYAFRDRGVIVMAVLPTLLVAGFWRARNLAAKNEGGTFTPWLMTGVQCYLAYLTYFYLAHGLRENILVINGSRIRPWWVQHHYWSAAASLLMLGMPVNSPAVQSFCFHFLLWSILQAAVMFLQNHYQRRRMYTRIALGKATAMDVVSGETSGGSGQLLLLYPMLIVLQVWQFSIGLHVISATYTAWLKPEGWLDMEAAEMDLRGARGIFLVALIFAYLAVQNFYNTLLTFLEKRKVARANKKALAAQAAKEE